MGRGKRRELSFLFPLPMVPRAKELHQSQSEGAIKYERLNESRDIYKNVIDTL